MPGKDESMIDTILHLKRHDPFSPFQIVTTSGDRYLIDNPDELAVAATQLHYYPRGGMGIHVRLNQITAVEEVMERPAA
ncbi:MAG: hypothetical protein M3O30_05370 [Planctomycetota bacterium]|nr:hypothetical protein [Planctomycetota bacterium]